MHFYTKTNSSNIFITVFYWCSIINAWKVFPLPDIPLPGSLCFRRTTPWSHTIHGFISPVLSAKGSNNWSSSSSRDNVILLSDGDHSPNYLSCSALTISRSITSESRRSRSSTVATLYRLTLFRLPTITFLVSCSRREEFHPLTYIICSLLISPQFSLHDIPTYLKIGSRPIIFLLDEKCPALEQGHQIYKIQKIT